MGRQKWEEAVATIACEPQLRVIEHLAHHAAWLLRRTRATLETIQSLAHDHSLPWAVEGAVRELDPEEAEVIKAALEEVVEAIRGARSQADMAIDERSKDSTVEGDEIAADIGPHLDDGKPAPCAS